MRASEKVRKAAYEKQQVELRKSRERLLQRLRERSEEPGDIWDEMAKEIEEKEKKC
ncbi:MAG: hypothetical protein ACWGQW_01940 [bacterium]